MKKLVILGGLMIACGLAACKKDDNSSTVTTQTSCQQYLNQGYPYQSQGNGIVINIQTGQPVACTNNGTTGTVACSSYTGGYCQCPTGYVSTTMYTGGTSQCTPVNGTFNNYSGYNYGYYQGYNPYAYSYYYMVPANYCSYSYACYGTTWYGGQQFGLGVSLNFNF